jgi:hypothetical protein
VPYTSLGFRKTAYLMDHFLKHGPDLNLSTPHEYEQAAIALFAVETSPTLLECTRPSCDIARIDLAFDRFGVLTQDMFIRTLYAPKPRHGELKRDYFARQCLEN